MTESVFVCSTVFDLIDLRAELEEELRSMKLRPVLSERPSSEFVAAQDRNSIESCLVNLANCDAVIVVLSRRYGRSLKAAGYDDISATHLEYRAARKLEKDIFFYVRDRLEVEYRLWKKDPKADRQELWVRKADEGLFRLVDRRCKGVARLAGTGLHHGRPLLERPPGGLELPLRLRRRALHHLLDLGAQAAVGDLRRVDPQEAALVPGAVRFDGDRVAVVDLDDRAGGGFAGSDREAGRGQQTGGEHRGGCAAGEHRSTFRAPPKRKGSADHGLPHGRAYESATRKANPDDAPTWRVGTRPSSGFLESLPWAKAHGS